MTYEGMVKGIFLKRPNRFIAHVLVDGKEEIAHVKNTGRCKELLIKGVTVYLEPSSNPNRKTKFTLIVVVKAGLLINMDSSAPNKLLHEAFTSGQPVPGFPYPLDTVISEYTYGDSRIDFLLGNGLERILVEVKGVTLEKEGRVYFPDAPTVRGIRHLEELSKGVKAGYKAIVCFVVKVENPLSFSPNWAQPAFGQALLKAKKAGVKVVALSCKVTPNTLTLDKPVPLLLEPPKP